MAEDLYASYPEFLGMPRDGDSEVRAKAAILPIPYDLTTSYQPGARRGPIAVLEASTHLESYDEELEADVFEQVGLITLPPVAPDYAGPQAMVERIERLARQIVQQGRLLIGLGGEHTISAPLIRASSLVNPGLGVLQLDAHADMYDEYEGSRYTHACVMRRVVDDGFPLAQVGIRSLTQDQHRLMREKGICTIFAAEAVLSPVEAWIGRVLDALPEKVYISVDLDVFDPAIMPATGTPEPGGLDWYRVLAVLRAVASRRRIVGFDVVELAPMPNNVAPDFLAAKLLYRLLGYAFLLGGK